MDTRQLFKKYYRRIAWQGFLKALLLALTLGFAVNFIMAFILWFTKLGLTAVLIIELGTFVVTTVVALPILYFKYFKPTTAKIAWLIDRLGLEERMVTMCEMEKNPSYVAMLQREDAKAKLKSVNHRDVKLKFSRLAFILLAVTFAMGASMTTVSALAATGSAKHGGEVFAPPEEENPEEEDKKEYVIVTYIAGEGGIIQGETLQKIEKGSDAEPVTAVPLDGYQFVVWDDGIMTAQRWDWSVMEDLTVEAQFEPLPEDEKGDGSEGEDGKDGEGDGEGDDKDKDGEDGDEGDKEGEDGEGSDGKDNGEEGDGEGDAPGEGDGPKGEGGPGGDGNTDDTSGSGGNSDGDRDGGGPDKGNNHPDDANGAGPGASPGKNTDNNNVVDGKTDYHDVVDTDKNKEELAGDESLPPELKDILDGYFDSLKP